MNKISIQDSLSFHPSFFSAEKELYGIFSDSTSYFLEVYLNSDWGCEYTFYTENYEDIDGGVIDDCEAENENDCANLLLEILEEANISCLRIMKYSEEEIEKFDIEVEKKWKEKQKELLRKIKGDR